MSSEEMIYTNDSEKMTIMKLPDKNQTDGPNLGRSGYSMDDMSVLKKKKEK
jgi:hypothetical protein